MIRKARLPHVIMRSRSRAMADGMNLGQLMQLSAWGLGLGTLFRFWTYRKWVFPEIPSDDEADRELAERDAVTPI